MKRNVFLTIAMLFLTIAVAAQAKEVAKFEETTHDFGTIKEEDGRVKTTFKFTNTLTTPLFIKGVRASCGCTSPNWSKAPIEANGEGEISATYSAAGRPGHFQKSITVTFSNGTEDFVKVLYIKGKVTPRAKTAAPAVQKTPQKATVVHQTKQATNNQHTVKVVKEAKPVNEVKVIK